MSLVAAFAVLALFAGLLAVTAKIDAATKAREQNVVANGLNAHVTEIANMVVPQANWDDAVRYLDLTFDWNWAGQNIGQYLGGTDHFDAAMVLDGADRPIYGWVRGTEMRNPRGYDAFVVASAHSVAQVRAGEIARGSLKGKKAANGLISPPVQSSDIRKVNGGLYV